MKFTAIDKLLLGVGAVVLSFMCVVLLVLSIGSLASPFSGPYNRFNRFCSWSTSWIHSTELRQRMVFNRSSCLCIDSL